MHAVGNFRVLYSAICAKRQTVLFSTDKGLACNDVVKCKKVLFTDKVNLKSLSQTAPAMKFRFLYFSCIFVGSCQQSKHIDIIKIVHDLNSLLLSDEGPMLETLDYTIRIGSTPTF